jgi:hypothetical protein
VSTRLETARLVIRTFEPRDAGAWLAMFHDPEVRRFLPGPALLLQGQPRLPAPPRHPGGHPGQGRPEEQPPRPRPPRRPPARLRRHWLPRAQHRGTLLCQAQAVPRRGHPLRQAGTHLPGHPRRRIDQDLAPRPAMTYKTGLTRAGWPAGQVCCGVGGHGGGVSYPQRRRGAPPGSRAGPSPPPRC